MVQTVTGAIDETMLGHCQMHEHLVVRPGPATRANAALLLDDEHLSAAELTDYRAAGGGAVLDAQPGGAGRDAARLARIGAASGVHVVCVTGYHLPMFYERGHWIFEDDESALYERFLGELLVRVAEADVRAGAVKAAIDETGPVGRARVCLRAAARAAAAMQVPLVLHTERGLHATAAVDLCAGAGLAPKRVLVCHADRQASDYGPHEAIAETGAFLEYDTIYRHKYHDDDAERRLILHMLDKGCEQQLLLSLDTTAARLTRYGGTPGLHYILKDFLHSLEELGVPRSTLRRITIENPARAFAQ